MAKKKSKIDKESDEFIKQIGGRANLRYKQYWWAYEWDDTDWTDDYWYREMDWYYEWLESIDRIRDEKISEILGEKRNPTLGDIFPDSLKNQNK